MARLELPKFVSAEKSPGKVCKVRFGLEGLEIRIVLVAAQNAQVLGLFY